MSHKAEQGTVWVVAGCPSAGKSTFADIFLSVLGRPAALLDKDTLFNPLIDSMLKTANRPLGERESEWFDSNIKPFTYRALTDAARQIRSYGCDVVITAPYTEALYQDGAWQRLTDELGGESTHLVWVRTDLESLQLRMNERGLARDGDKLEDLARYAERMRIDRLPVACAHHIDNRLLNTKTLAAQAQQLLTRTR